MTWTRKSLALLGLVAAFGVAAIGQGTRTRLLVGLADGRVALISPQP